MAGRQVGSLCSGYGGLDEAVLEVLGGELSWVADDDKFAAAALSARYPGVPNLGDIRHVDWRLVPPVDVLAAGFPCQDVSQAGTRRGMLDGSRTGVWAHVSTAIGVLRPPLVFLENVRGLRSAKADGDVEWCAGCMGDPKRERLVRALGAVLASLAGLGYDAEWDSVRASDAGACHQRERVFILAWPAADADRAAGGQRRLAAS